MYCRLFFLGRHHDFEFLKLLYIKVTLWEANLDSTKPG